jgi:hypothetical protein
MLLPPLTTIKYCRAPTYRFRAGKTSLARSLKEKYPGSQVLHADRYWQVKKPFSEEAGEYNWEVPGTCGMCWYFS